MRLKVIKMRLKFFGPNQIVFLILLAKACMCSYEKCDRRPLGFNTDPLPPDNRFTVDVAGLRDNKYIPEKEYTVRLSSRDGVSTFIAFTISLREDTMENPKNPRRPTLLSAGKLEPLSNSNNTVPLLICENTVIQSETTPKTFVEAKWIAPRKNNKCVTIFAVVAVMPGVWYNYDGPLSKRICEDRRKADDIQPMENENCQVCEDARYKLTFEGMWSYNTHPTMYPNRDELVARFSDVVGASHTKEFSLFKFNSEASDGLKLLAEQGNTTIMEVEISRELGSNVRTIIKATAPPETNMETVSTFRVSRKHHMVSLATAILPSPDWFLGVANLELCARNQVWAESITYNLYPMDAGTDSGKKFDSSNEATAPAQPITTATIDAAIDKEDPARKPFARLVFHLIRTYYNPNCTVETAVTEQTGNEGETGEPGEGEDGDSGEVSKNTEYRPSPPTTTTSEEPPPVDPDSTKECPMTPWEDWQECEGECIDNVLDGYHIRFRNHIGDPASECLKEPLTETEACEEACEEEEPEEESEEEEDE